MRILDLRLRGIGALSVGRSRLSVNSGDETAASLVADFPEIKNLGIIK